MNTRFQDLNYYELDDGTIRLEQIGYTGEDSVIDAHPEQIKFIVRQLCGVKSERPEQVADLERRIGVLVYELQRIVCDEFFRTGLTNECDDGFVYLAKLDGLLNLALEYDHGRLKPEYPEEDDPKPVRTPKPPGSAVDISSAAKTQPSATVQAADQL